MIMMLRVCIVPISILEGIKTDYLPFLTLIVAIATLYLAFSNRRLSKDNLIKEQLLQEMEVLIKPLYTKIIQYGDNFGKLEYVRVEYPPIRINTFLIPKFNEEYNYARIFWDGINANKYLAPKDMRNLLNDYLSKMEEWGEKYKSPRIQDIAHKDVGKNLMPSKKESLIFLNSLLNMDVIYSQMIVEKTKLKLLDELIITSEPDDEIRKCAEELRNFIEIDTVLKNKRKDLVIMVKTRYGELEKKIDKIHESLDKE